MVTISQIQRGFVHFVDNEIATAFSGWQKTVVAGSAGLLAANFPNLVNVYANKPFVAALGVYDAASNAVNIDALYDAFVPQMGSDKIPIAIPKIGIIKLGPSELEALVRYIKEA